MESIPGLLKRLQIRAQDVHPEALNINLKVAKPHPEDMEAPSEALKTRPGGLEDHLRPLMAKEAMIV